MNITLNIKGEGRVNGVKDGDNIILTSISDDSWTFKHYLIGEEVRKEDPMSIKDEVGIKVEAVFYVTIEDYLKGLVAFDVTETALNSIRIYRGIAKGTDVSELTDKQKELAYADLLIWASTLPSSYTGSKQSDGGWTQTEPSKTISVSDKKGFREQAMDIYKRYGDRKYSAKIRITSLW